MGEGAGAGSPVIGQYHTKSALDAQPVMERESVSSGRDRSLVLYMHSCSHSKWIATASLDDLLNSMESLFRI